MDFQYEFIAESVKPEYKARGKYVDIVEKWLKTNNKTLKFMCKNTIQKKNVCTSLRSYAQSHHYDYTVFPERSTNNVYVVRA